MGTALSSCLDPAHSSSSNGENPLAQNHHEMHIGKQSRPVLRWHMLFLCRLVDSSFMCSPGAHIHQSVTTTPATPMPAHQQVRKCKQPAAPICLFTAAPTSPALPLLQTCGTVRLPVVCLILLSSSSWLPASTSSNSMLCSLRARLAFMQNGQPAAYSSHQCRHIMSSLPTACLADLLW